MKKKIIFSLIILSYVFSSSCAISIEVKSSDYKIVNESTVVDNSNADIETIKDNDSILIFKKNNKIGVLDKKTNSLIGQPNIEEIQAFSPENETEYKIKIKNYVGYLNTNTKSCFLSNYDDIYLTDKYIKVKKDDKFGFIDKEGNIILNPLFEKVGIFRDKDKEYLAGKIDGKVKLFYNSGKLISENEFYTVPTKENYALSQDLKPILQAYRKKGSTVYKKSPAEPKDHNVYEIQEIPIKDKVQIAAIQKFEAPVSFKESSDIFTVGKKNYTIVRDNHKIGLNDKNGNEVIPAIYNKINVRKPCAHSSYEVISAERNHSHTLYDLKGKIVAEQVYDKVNIYKYGKIYTYSKEGDKWVLRVNNKEIGNMTFRENDYKFEKTHFSLFSLHRINELFITLVTSV